ncbi:MAG: ATP-binding protein [Planctomycetota bacterium]|jgi:signal transduction histidine kinase
MSLREKILLVLLAMLCCYGGVEFYVLRKVVAPELEKQEQQHARENIRRSTDAIQTRLKGIQKELSALSQSGHFYSHIQSPSANPTDLIAPNLNLDFLTVYDNTWNQISCKSDQVDFENIEKVLFDSKSPVIKQNIPGYSGKTLVRCQDQILLVISTPITRSSLSQTVEGTVVAGQFLTTERLEAIRNQLQLNFNWDFIDPDRLVGQNKEIIQRVNAAEPFDLIPVGEEFLQASAVLYDYQKQPILLIKTFQDRTISQQSLHVMLMVLCSKIIIGVVAILLLIWLLQRVVINPIIRLIKHIVNIEHPGKRKTAPLLSRKDEIGTLANEFTKMCRRLQNAQVKLMEKSYLSGVTEMSSGILHNVRNALSPITTRIERIKGQFKSVPLENLEQAQSELQLGSLGAERRRDLMRFVDLTFQDVLMNLNEMVTGLDDLSEQVFQIEEMLNIQRTFGREDKPVEFVEPTELLNKALDMVPESVRNECRISIDSKIKKLPAIPVEPTTFVQILQNLLINAAESLEKESPLYRKIHISADVETIDERQTLHWQIQDNGGGIADDKIHQIFERGASSKRKGLTGIGLHWCANTLTAMKGRIWAESQGLHCGALFHILIPMAPEEELVEAIQETNE